MSNCDLVLEVKGIGKAFKSYTNELDSSSGKVMQETFSLKDISFHLFKGQILGVIGNNGAGKSTLLKILSGLIMPQSGTVTYHGKLSSILDIGSGFHPDLTGIDNVYMVARLIGYSTTQIDKLLNEIIEFSGLHQFMHTQIKHYSSGMFMRLAFSLYTTLKSDILIIDEVLSVGDMSFREKSSARIKEIAASGTTIIIASHEMKTIQNLCTHGLLLDGGSIKGFDTIQNIIDKYIDNDFLTLSNSALSYTKKNGGTDSTIILRQATVKAVNKSLESDIFMDDEIEISFDFEKRINYPVILSAVIADKFGNNLMSLCSYRMADTANFIDTTPTGRYIQSLKLPRGLFNAGIFSVSFYLADQMQNEVESFEKLLYFKVWKSDIKFNVFDYRGNYSCPLYPIGNWSFSKPNSA